MILPSAKPYKRYLFLALLPGFVFFLAYNFNWFIPAPIDYEAFDYNLLLGLYLFLCFSLFNLFIYLKHYYKNRSQRESQKYNFLRTALEIILYSIFVALIEAIFAALFFGLILFVGTFPLIFNIISGLP